MVRPSIWTLAWAAVAIASSARAAVDDGNKAPAGAWIVEVNTPQDIEPVADALRRLGGQVSQRFNSDIFRGFSVRQASLGAVGQDRIQTIPGVKSTWPWEALNSVKKEDTPEQQPEVPPPGRRHLSRRAEGNGVGFRWNHIMTQVDKLHAEGFLGNGIKIAIVDTGVNYTHPALGGCLGPGCRVAMGDDFTKKGKRGDPMDCQGHGTAVAGILAGDDKEAGFVGVAPRATLAAYKVVDCDGASDAETMISGWTKAYEDGAQIIASSSGISDSAWSSGPIATVVSRISAKGVPCIVGVGNERRTGLFYTMDPSSGRGVTAVTSFAHKGVAPGQQSNNGSAVRTAGMSQASVSGPTWDLYVKPNVGAPGDDIPCPKPRGGYEVCFGTSFSGPQVAGMVALIAERRGTFDPVLINSLLMATAELQEDGGPKPVMGPGDGGPKPVMGPGDGGLIPVSQQGGGLVRAWDAAHATTVLEPASLAFNDTEHRVSSISLRITNMAESEVVYKLSEISAHTAYSRKLGNFEPFEAPEHVKAAATIKISNSSVTVGPGQSATVDVSAEDPEGLDQERLPVWSGWVAVNSSDGKSLTIPYLGLAGSLHSHHVLTGAEIRERDRTYESRDEFSYEKKDGVLSVSVPLLTKTMLGSPLVRPEIVPVSPPRWLAERLGDRKSLPVAGLPREWRGRYHDRVYTKFAEKFDGQLEWGDYLPMGEYKFVVHALRIFGDAKVASDWDTAETGAFSVGQAAGEEACKIYLPGSPKMPEGTLFQDLEECLQAHGKILMDAPWVSEPQDKSKCNEESPTEAACGTDRFCKAHQDEATFQDFRTPWRTVDSCLQNHKSPAPGSSRRAPKCRAAKDEDTCG